MIKPIFQKRQGSIADAKIRNDNSPRVYLAHLFNFLFYTFLVPFKVNLKKCHVNPGDIVAEDIENSSLINVELESFRIQKVYNLNIHLTKPRMKIYICCNNRFLVFFH